MKINLTENAAPTPIPAGNIRTPLGQRGRVEINQTCYASPAKTRPPPWTWPHSNPSPTKGARP